MRLLRLLKNTIGLGRSESVVPIEFREMILIIQPRECAVLWVKPGSTLIVSGFAGTMRISTPKDPVGMTVKHGQSLNLNLHGKIIIESLASHVPGRLHVVYQWERSDIHLA